MHDRREQLKPFGKLISKDTKRLHDLARLLDNRFRIPGTPIRFGIDAIIGLIPGFGDVASLLVALYLVIKMHRMGASPRLVVKMLINVFIDFLLGLIPFLGDIFDTIYKSNLRNTQLMIEYAEEGRHQGSAAQPLILLLILITTIVYIIYWLFSRLLGVLF